MGRLGTRLDRDRVNPAETAFLAAPREAMEAAIQTPRETMEAPRKATVTSREATIMSREAMEVATQTPREVTEAPREATEAPKQRSRSLPPLVCVALLECDVAAVQSATSLTLAPQCAAFS